ncbi:MAG: SDR family NAD(P)-dependent oxidoreductase [Anaerolineae bacterium]|nr:SDR family NAD(P)-dependent oxidoreductase [Anaerolineae bacterium]
MTTLITGGAGFIGSRLAAHLIERGDSVVLLDNFDSYYDPAFKRARIAALKGKYTLVEGDIRDEAAVARVFADYGVTRVAHLAAMSGVRYSVENGRLYADVNTAGSVTLMNASRQHNVSVFVQASTSSVYGQAAHTPFVETDDTGFPLAPYPASKRAAELFGHSYHNLFGLNVTVLRFFNVYGPFGRPDMMPLMTIDNIRSGKTINLFNGGDIHRDWTYVDDTVAGIMAALERPLGFEIINLGYGAPVSLTAFIEIYEKLLGQKAITKDVPAPASEPLITYCDNTRARDLLGFNPQVDIAEGLARTWAWYRDYYRV